MRAGAQISVLTIGSNEGVDRSIASCLDEKGFRNLTAGTGRDGLQVFRSEQADLVLISLQLPDIGGAVVLETIAGESPETPAILMADQPSLPEAYSELHKGAWDLITIPIEDHRALRFVLERALLRARLTRENREYRERLAEQREVPVSALPEARAAEASDEVMANHQGQLAQVRFLENMELIDRAIRQKTDLEQMLRDVIDTVFTMFDCDRAWLLFPCDPSAPSFRVPMETARAEYPGAQALNLEVPMAPATATDCREGLAADGPLTYGPGCARPMSSDTATQFSVQSQIFMAIYPKVGKPWLFGMHQCSRVRVWSKHEQRLFTAIGRRIADALSTLLMLRDLRASEAKYRTLVDNLPQRVFLKSTELVYISCNESYAEDLKISPAEIVGKSDYDFYPRDLADKYRADDRRIISSGQTMEIEEEYLRDDTARIVHTIKTPVTDQGNLIGVLGVFRDITDRRRAEEEKERLQSQLRQSQKLEAVGRLAGGVAHDFNNILTAILGNLELIIGDLGDSPATQSSSLHNGLLQIQRGALRAAELTRQLLTFSHQQVLQPEILDLNAILRETENMLRRLITEDIELISEPAADLDPIRADAGQIEQVIVNLVVNAGDAMAEGGRLTLRTAKASISSTNPSGEHVATHGEVMPGPHVVLEVSDTGCGMDAATIESIFDPFFTTKPVGQGTGLGLATVYGIITQAGGHISVDSTPGQGSVFRAYFPAVHAPSLAPQLPRRDEDVLRGTETILVCEDDEGVRQVAVDILSFGGYAVIAAANGRQALQLAAEHGESIQLLLTDVIMPEMNGRQLSETLTAQQPGLRTLFISGYSLDVIGHHGELDQGIELLEKPFTSRELLRRVRAELDKVGA